MNKAFNWRLPLSGVVGAAIAVSPTLIFGNGILAFLATAALGAVIGFILVIVFVLNIRVQSIAAFVMVAAFCGGSWIVFRVADDIRTTARWQFQSAKYKAAILAQRESRNDGLRHVEWDGWGFPGEENVEFLVFDPADSLRVAARSDSPGKYIGIPCEVPKVRRLEDHWYTVFFYTQTFWNYCE